MKVIHRQSYGDGFLRQHKRYQKAQNLIENAIFLCKSYVYGQRVTATGIIINNERIGINLEVQYYGREIRQVGTDFDYYDRRPKIRYNFTFDWDREPDVGIHNLTVRLYNKSGSIIFLENYPITVIPRHITINPERITKETNSSTYTLYSEPKDYYISNLSQNSIDLYGVAPENSEIFFQLDNKKEKVDVLGYWNKNIPLTMNDIGQDHILSISSENQNCPDLFFFKYVSTPYLNYSLSKKAYRRLENITLHYNLASTFDDRKFNISYKFKNQNEFSESRLIGINEEPILLSTPIPDDLEKGHQKLIFKFFNDKTGESSETPVYFDYCISLSYVRKFSNAQFLSNSLIPSFYYKFL